MKSVAIAIRNAAVLKVGLNDSTATLTAASALKYSFTFARYCRYSNYSIVAAAAEGYETLDMLSSSWAHMMYLLFTFMVTLPLFVVASFP